MADPVTLMTRDGQAVRLVRVSFGSLPVGARFWDAYDYVPGIKTGPGTMRDKFDPFDWCATLKPETPVLVLES